MNWCSEKEGNAGNNGEPEAAAEESSSTAKIEEKNEKENDQSSSITIKGIYFEGCWEVKDGWWICKRKKKDNDNNSEG